MHISAAVVALPAHRQFKDQLWQRHCQFQNKTEVRVWKWLELTSAPVSQMLMTRFIRHKINIGWCSDCCGVLNVSAAHVIGWDNTKFGRKTFVLKFMNIWLDLNYSCPVCYFPSRDWAAYYYSLSTFDLWAVVVKKEKKNKIPPDFYSDMNQFSSSGAKEQACIPPVTPSAACD